MKRGLAGSRLDPGDAGLAPERVPSMRLLAAGIAVAASIAWPTASYAQWWKTVDGCLAYEHRDYKGATFTVDATKTYSYVGTRWNDRISSIICEVYCTITVWEHRDYQGAARTFGDHTKYVGSAWNDKISSMEASCEE